VIADVVNGSFELLGGFMLWQNVRAIRRDKAVRGVRILPTAFFTLWGIWNLYFYPSLGQWASFVGGLNIVVANLIWVGLMVRYSRPLDKTNPEGLIS
jgi:hypothetical protein